MDECELVTLVTATACAISKCSSDDELSILSVVFTQLGDTLATVLTKRQLCDKNLNNNNKDEQNKNIKCDKDK